MAESLPSLDLIADELRREREDHIRHLDEFESRAGILLGSSGVVAAIGSQGANATRAPGLGLAVLAALTALWTLLPQRHPTWDTERLRSYVRSDPAFTRLMMLGTEIDMLTIMQVALQRKRRLLRTSAALLALAVTCIAVATIFD